MLHGNPTWSFFYRNLVVALLDKCRVMVPDHSGCGFSDKPADYEYRLANHIANVERLLEHLKVDSFSLCVHDWGGPIGLGVAVSRPSRLQKFVVFNTTCMLTKKYPLRILICKVPVIGQLAIRGLNLFAGAAVNIAVSKKLDPAVKAGFIKPYDNYANRIATLKFIHDIPLGPGHPSWEKGEEVMSRLQSLDDVPMLICWGKRDFCFNDHFLEGWRKQFPRATVHEFADANHYVIEDALDEIRPLVRDFLISAEA
jgi:haloalkane dehalogenase